MTLARRWDRYEADRADLAYEAVVRSGAFGATATETRRELARRLAEVRDAATEGDRYRAWERLRRDLDAASPGAGVALFPLATEAVRLSAEVMPS